MHYFLLGLIMSGTLKIYKDNINKKRHVIDRNRVRRLSKTNIKNIPCTNVREKYEDKIENFINVIKKELPFIDLTFLNSNIGELRIEENKLSGNTTGNFNIDEILITLLENDYNKSISHELFHLSSSIFSGETYFVGFRQENDDFDIGRGLNEGYTSLLDDRYFGIKATTYYPMQILSSSIELIVGQEKMTKKYFKADLYGLIKDLSEYCLEGKIYKMLKNMDVIFHYIVQLNLRDLSKEETEELQQKINEVIKILFEMLINKLEINYNQGIINHEEAEKLFNGFYMNLQISCTKNDELIYKFISYELYQEILKENFIKNNSNEENNNIKKIK